MTGHGPHTRKVKKIKIKKKTKKKGRESERGDPGRKVSLNSLYMQCTCNMLTRLGDTGNKSAVIFENHMTLIFFYVQISKQMKNE